MAEVNAGEIRASLSVDLTAWSRGLQAASAQLTQFQQQLGQQTQQGAAQAQQLGRAQAQAATQAAREAMQAARLQAQETMQGARTASNERIQAFWAARRSHAKTVSSVTPKTKPMSPSATLTSSIFKAIMTFSSGVLRSKKTVSRVSEKGRSHSLQRKIRRLPLWVI